MVIMYHLLGSCMTQASSSDNIAKNEYTLTYHFGIIIYPIVFISIVAAFINPNLLFICLRTRDIPYESFGDVAINRLAGSNLVRS